MRIVIKVVAMILGFTFYMMSVSYAAKLIWDASSGTVDGYKVYYGTTATPSNSKTVGNVTSYNLDNLPLSENVQYYLTLTAYNSAGESAPSLPVIYTPGDSTPPFPPSGLTAKVTSAAAFKGLPITAVTSSGDDGNVAANTIDDDLSTRWSSSGNGQWIQYDLGATCDLSEIMIAFFVGDTRTSAFEVFVSQDALSWNSAFKGQSSGTSLEQQSFTLTNATGRFLRIVGYGNSDNDWNSITEVDILGRSS